MSLASTMLEQLCAQLLFAACTVSPAPFVPTNWCIQYDRVARSFNNKVVTTQCLVDVCPLHSGFACDVMSVPVKCALVMLMFASNEVMDDAGTQELATCL